MGPTIKIDDKEYDLTHLTELQDNIYRDIEINNEATKLVGYLRFCLALVKEKQLLELKTSIEADPLIEPIDSTPMPDLNYNREAVTSFNTYQITGDEDA